MAKRGPAPDLNVPVGRLVLKDFPGFAPAVDPHLVPPGTAVLAINAMSLRAGELRVRPGFSVVRFDTP